MKLLRLSLRIDFLSQQRSTPNLLSKSQPTLGPNMAMLTVDSLRIEEGLKNFPPLEFENPDDDVQLMFNPFLRRSSAIVVCSNGKVFRHGGCKLGSIQGWAEIEILSGKYVRMIARGLNFYLALTGDGSVFSWGDNRFGQLGHGSAERSNHPRRIQNLEAITYIACGQFHCLALNACGQVFRWGSTIRNGRFDNQRIPVVISALSNIRDITCTIGSSFAINKEDQVYSWGENLHGELGLSKAKPFDGASEQTIYEIGKFKKLAAGNMHVLALKETGELFVWGYNDSGELGLNRKTSRENPQKLCEGVSDIICMEFTSAYRTLDGKIHVSGRFETGKISTPQPTSFRCFSQITCEVYWCSKLLICNQWDEFLKRATLREAFKKNLALSLNDPQSSDVVFTVDGNKILAHRDLLSAMNSFFALKFSGNWADSYKSDVQLDDHRYEDFYSFLNFLYTGKIAISNYNAIDLLKIADFYMDTLLQYKCSRVLCGCLVVGNFSEIFTASVKYCQNDLELLCLKFAQEHAEELNKGQIFSCLSEDLKERIRDHSADLRVERHIANQKLHPVHIGANVRMDQKVMIPSDVFF